jgi:hypothetical protein
VSSELVPVFIPPLAMVLGAAEREKGAPLSEPEVLALRDESTTMMMDPADAEQMAVSRGLRDVEPEDCWADWHRLRVEYSGKGYLPKFVLCLVGDAAFGEHAAKWLRAEGVEHEVEGYDARMVTAFESSACRVRPSLGKPELAEISHHESVVYVLSPHFTAGQAVTEAARMLALGAHLLSTGGLAMKCDSSGIAHGRERWGTLAKSPEAEALFQAFVRFPIRSEQDYYTCGMHLLGKPDLIATDAAMQGSAREVLNLYEAFALYLLTECLPRHFASGHTFRCDEDSPRYVVRWEACTGYDEDDFFFNPFGRYRFERE